MEDTVKKLAYFAMLVATLGMVIWPVAELQAGNPRCGTTYYDNSCYQPTYYQPTYTAPTYPQIEYVDRYVPYPVPFTVAVPVVSYIHNGGGSGYVPAYQAQQASPGGYMQQPQQQVQQQPQMQAPTANAPTSSLNSITDEQIDYIIMRIEQRLANKANQTQPQTNFSTPPPAVPRNPLTIFTVKRGFDKVSCADCHTGSASKKGFQIFTSPGKLNPNLNWVKVLVRCDNGTMPPEATSNKLAALSDGEMDALKQYASGNVVAPRR